MKTSASTFHLIHNRRYHVRTWGNAGQKIIFLLHGWMDLSASFQYLVDALKHDWYVVAPDWRGFGLSEWNTGVYWFPEYLADLETLLKLYSPDDSANLVGHSMGGNVASLFAGVRPKRVRKLVSIEGVGITNTQPSQAPERYERWFNDLERAPSFRTYRSFDELAQRLLHDNPRLGTDKAAFLAPHWARQTDTGEVVLRSDPKHKIVNPILYRIEEAIACWERITAPVLWVYGGASDIQKRFAEPQEQYVKRKSAFKNITECTIPDASHMVHLDQPAELARAIEEFLQ